jgi:hypothetical protein
MEQIPTAEELIDKTGSHEFWQEFHWVKEDLNDKMIEFARLHVEAALKAAFINGELTHIKYTENDYCIDEKSIINSYPLENIK